MRNLQARDFDSPSEVASLQFPLFVLTPCSRPCSPSAAICLVNDLDLVVQASGLAGYTLYGNGQPDHLNNVERVHKDFT